MKRTGLLVAALLLVAAGAAGSYPTLSGESGLLQVPTADVMTLGNGEVAADWMSVPGGGDGLAVRGVVGLGPNAEVGAAWRKFSTEPDGRLVGVGGKLQLLGEPRSLISLAVGARFDDSSGALFRRVGNTFQAYAVVSKDLTHATQELATAAVRVRGHVGLLSNNSDDDNSARGFIGVDFTSPEGSQLLLEYWNHARDDVSSVALRYPLAPMLSLQVGITNALGSDHRLVGGLNLHWGLGG